MASEVTESREPRGKAIANSLEPIAESREPRAEALFRDWLVDLKIASICLVHDGLLLTRNLSDFAKVPGLRVENRLD